MTPAARITCEIDKSLSAQALSTLDTMHCELAQVHPRRAVALSERAALPFLPPTTRLEEDPVEVFEVYLPRAQARGTVLTWARALGLFTPGRGSIYAEEVEILNPPGTDFCASRLAGADAPLQPGERLSSLALINCVVQRNYGNGVARCAIEAGSNVPSINFGIGTGVRDRLGLLRIAIPAEKEIVSLLVNPHDEPATLDSLIDAGRLDLPGRGFIGAYPVSIGVANSKSSRGRQRHSATMDQVIAAIDELKAGTAWRQRSGAADAAPRRQRRWLTDLVNVTLNCNEGSADRLVSAAIAAGAGGATITKAKLFSPSGAEFAASPAREVADLGIGPDKLDRLIAALRDCGAFDAETACFIETKPLPIAYTYAAA
jgi:hypothetical protein